MFHVNGNLKCDGAQATGPGHSALNTHRHHASLKKLGLRVSVQVNFYMCY